MLAQKKKRGPPATGKGEQVVVRMQPPNLSALDAWIARQPEPRPTRPQAIRRLVEQSLGGAATPLSDASLNRQIAEKETAIANLPDHSEPSPEAGMAAMDKAMAEN